MSRQAWLDILAKAVLTAVFFFVFQRYVLKASFETSALWSVLMALSAAWLAWTQWKRGG